MDKEKQIEKWTKDMKGQFTEQKNPLALRQVKRKRCSTLFMVRDGEMETTQKDHFYLPYGQR